MITLEFAHLALIWPIALIVPRELLALPARPTIILMLALVKVVEQLVTV